MLQNNFEFLKTYYAELYMLLTNNREHNVYELVETNGFKNLAIDNKYIHSRYNPLGEASTWVEGIKIGEEDAICVLGLGLGYILEPLIAKYPDKKIIIIEPSLEVFEHLLTVRDISKYIQSDKIVFLVAKNSNDIRSLFEHYIQNNKIKKISFQELPFYRKMYKNYIEDVYADLKKILMLLKSNLSTIMCFSKDWLYNTLRNLKYIKNYNNISCLDNLLKDIPTVIVSAGPSLEKNIDLLKEIYNKALIIAVGTSASILDSHGIKAHIIMGIDGHPVETEVFKSLKNHEALFIYANMIHFEAIGTYKGSKMWLNLYGEKTLELFFEKIGVKYPSIVSGGSIAHTALAFANWAQSSPIMLIGQDLAYTGDKLYATGSSHQLDYITNENFIEAKDIYGNKAYTKTAFLTYKHWFEDYVKLRLGNNKVLNCTEGGLAIDGIPNMTFMDAIKRYCQETHDIKAIIDEALKSHGSSYDIRVEEKFKKYEEELKTCIELSEKRLNKIIDILQNEIYKSEKFNKVMSQVLKITNKMEKYEFYSIFIKSSGEMFNDAITKATNHELEAIKSLPEKRKIITLGLLRQYRFANDNLIVSKGALEEKTVEGLFLI